MNFTGYAVEVFPRRHGESIDFVEIARALRARGLHADIDATRNQVWCDPTDVGPLVDIINSLGYETDEDTRVVDPADEALDRLIDEVADIEQRRFEEEQKRVVEEQMAEEARLDEMWPLSRFAHLANPDTLRRAAWQGRLVAEKIGRDWFTSEREIRRYLAGRRSKRG